MTKMRGPTGWKAQVWVADSLDCADKSALSSGQPKPKRLPGHRTPNSPTFDCGLVSSALAFVPSFISLYSTESTNARQLASTILAETPTVPHEVFPSVEVISTRTRLAVPESAPLMTRTL